MWYQPQVISLWPPSCTKISYHTGFPTGSLGSTPTQDNAMLQRTTANLNKANAILAILMSTPEENDHLLQHLMSESKSCQNPSIIRGAVRSPNSSDLSLKVGSSTMCNEWTANGSTYWRQPTGLRTYVLNWYQCQRRRNQSQWPIDKR